MMEQLNEEEQFLLLGKVAGSLSPDEEIAVAQLFLNNPHALPAYKELTGALPAASVADQFAKTKANLVWRDLKTEYQNRQQSTPEVVSRIPIYKRVWAAAAIFIGLLAVSALLWQQWQKRATTIASNPNKPAIELKLADGKVINLSQQQGAIDAGTTQLNNSDKSLSYSVDNNDVATGVNTLTVPIGMDYKINLADGSEVWLNSATKMEFPLSFTGKTREITINGEAYLKVAKNAKLPFIVHLPNSSVQVLGTEFNVNSYDSGVVKVALVEGSVNMTAPTGDSKLAPGRQATYNAGQAITQEAFDARSTLSWRKGLFYFNDASLAEISKVVPRWYGINLKIDDAEINERRFTGVINRNRSIETFLEDLKVIARINAYFDKDSVLHLKQ